MSGDVNKTLAARGKNYGAFIDNATVSQKIKAIIREGAAYNQLDQDQREALEMIGQKMARIINGRGDYADNWHDIAGYALLVEKRLVNGEKGTAGKP